MRNRSPRVLLIQDDPADIQLVAEAFAEIEESPTAGVWLRRCDLELADDPGVASRMAAEGLFDAAVLDLSIGGGRGAAVYREIAAAAPALPVVLLGERDDQPLTLTLVREGAQECLLKSELDCLPLARAVRCAIERHRALEARRSMSLLDDLTGLYSLRGFLHLAERLWTLAAQLSQPLRLDLVEVTDPGGDTQQRDLRLIQIAEAVHARCTPADVAGRIGAARFAWLRIGAALSGPWPDDLGSVAVEAAPRPGGGLSYPSMEHLLAAAESALCENKAVNTPG
jgi:DNA-binding NarL/FixJ family response regulator